MIQRTAVVVGGGIGGLAAAVGLSRTGHRVTDVVLHEDGAEVRYETRGGSATLRAGLVVAADGVFSGVREGLFPNHPEPAYAAT